jgi:hypothetical protein
MESRKRKRGKFKTRLVEDDDEAIDVVTFKEVETDTPGGRVTKRIEVPLRPKLESKAGANPPVETTFNSWDRSFEHVGIEMNTPDDEPRTNEPQKNTVCQILFL